jgi:hypothetical protein
MVTKARANELTCQVGRAMGAIAVPGRQAGNHCRRSGFACDIHTVAAFADEHRYIANNQGNL